MTVHHGDCIEVMATFDAESIDAIVTDPPYGLGFMGKAWDHGVPGVPFWREMLRVAKPGAHLLAFGGTRTVHRIATSIEDAGWEIRDTLVWAYASGFPKSLDVSKAIDKANGNPLAWRRFAAAYDAAVKASTYSHADIDRHLGIKSSSCYWVRTDARGGLPPRHHWEAVRDLLALDADYVRLYDEAEREVIGNRDVPEGHAFAGPVYGGDSSSKLVDITAPATPEAEQWQGWGTALKPAWEPIVLARKPLRGTVAGNVLEYGTGALNIDACRIGTSKDVPASPAEVGHTGILYQPPPLETRGGMDPNIGRWPANVILTDPIFDGDTPGVVGGGETTSGVGVVGSGSGHDDFYNGGIIKSSFGDSGTYSRFFLVPKAARSDREPVLGGTLELGPPPGSKRSTPAEGRSSALGRPRENAHPTVKPTELMRHLVRLVTPPGGTVLDPFLGSGTTALAAEMEGFEWVGIEREAEYVAIAEARLNGTQRGLGLAV